jgi:hypothetical protein
MTVMPGQKFHPATKCVTAAHDVASWGCRRQDFVRFVDANLPQKGLDAICNCIGFVSFTKR